MRTTMAKAFFLLLALLLGANALLTPAHPHFEAEAVFGFWPLFGLAGGLALCVAGGAMLAPLLRCADREDRDAR
uniref:DUF1049 domain-containing protein n=1 Tax=Fundidesulfovibrio putealis TaxID=270496 RepID=A0A7C4AAD2_9BACT